MQIKNQTRLFCILFFIIFLAYQTSSALITNTQAAPIQPQQSTTPPTPLIPPNLTLSSYLQNCKTLSPTFPTTLSPTLPLPPSLPTCIQCFPSYILVSNDQVTGYCTKNLNKNINLNGQDNSINCQVFDQNVLRCLLCQDGFVSNGRFGCQRRVVVGNGGGNQVKNVNGSSNNIGNGSNMANSVSDVLFNLSQQTIFDKKPDLNNNNNNNNNTNIKQTITNTTPTTTTTTTTTTSIKTNPNNINNNTPINSTSAPIVNTTTITNTTTLKNSNSSNSMSISNSSTPSSNLSTPTQVTNTTKSVNSITNNSSTNQPDNPTPTPTTNSSPTPQLLEQINPTTYNITLKVDPRTKTVFTIIGTTKTPPSKYLIERCSAYRDISYECVECVKGYVVYKGECIEEAVYRDLGWVQGIVYGKIVGIGGG